MTIHEATFDQLHAACLESKDLPFCFEGYITNLRALPLPYEWHEPLLRQLEARKVMAELFRLTLHTEGSPFGAEEVTAA